MVDPRIQHIFVLMLENRSFDHMLGRSGIAGIEGLAGDETNIDSLTGKTLPLLSPAPFRIEPDLPHEYPNVLKQMCGPGADYPKVITDPRQTGFVDSYRATPGTTLPLTFPGAAMAAFTADQLPILTALARNFQVCDHWYSSLPGPTWPNRFFVHAATSGGLYKSPSNGTVILASTVNGFTFENGTIYDRLEAANVPWRIYHGDPTPQVLSLSVMHEHYFTNRYRPFDQDFARDLANPAYPIGYTFIEPNYDLTGSFKGGNSQHAIGDITEGEKLIKTVYETIRNSPHWSSSMLVILYDEHGGFFDHLIPTPAATPPGDEPRHADDNPVADDPGGNTGYAPFDFRRYGVRVPAVVISPYVDAGVCSTVFDHAAIPATLAAAYGFTPLTARDQSAVTEQRVLTTLLTRDAESPRMDPADAPTNLGPVASEVFAPAGFALAKLPDDAAQPLTAADQSYLHLTTSIAVRTSGPAEQAAIIARANQIRTKGQARQFHAEVQQGLAAKQAISQGHAVPWRGTPVTLVK
jgi:phospholipase C